MNSKTKRNLVCSHTFNSKKKSKKNSQCYPDELNYKMKDVWNSKYHDNKSKRIYSSSPKEIKQELYDKNKECNHDICLIKNVLPKEDYESTLPYFAPIANWKPNSNSSWGAPTLYCHEGVTEVGSDEETKIQLTVKSVKKREVSNLALLSSIERGNDQRRLQNNIKRP